MIFLKYFFVLVVFIFLKLLYLLFYDCCEILGLGGTSSISLVRLKFCEEKMTDYSQDYLTAVDALYVKVLYLPCKREESIGSCC